MLYGGVLLRAHFKMTFVTIWLGYMFNIAKGEHYLYLWIFCSFKHFQKAQLRNPY